MKFSPAACCFSRTWFGPGSGTSISTTCIQLRPAVAFDSNRLGLHRLPACARPARRFLKRPGYTRSPLAHRANKTAPPDAAHSVLRDRGSTKPTRVEAALRSVKWADEIVVADSFSTDCDRRDSRGRYTNRIVQCRSRDSAGCATRCSIS